MAFNERLRASNVFGGSNRGHNPFEPKGLESPLGMLDQYIARLPRGGMGTYPIESQPPVEPGNINLIKPDRSKMNTVYQQNISPLDQAKLGQKEREIEQRGKIAEDKEASRQKEIDIRSRRADIYGYKARNPNLKFDFTGRTVRVLNPATGEMTDTGIDSRELSETEKMELNQTNALERIEAGGDQTRQTNTQRTIDTIDINARRAEEQRKTNEAKAKTKVVKGQTPSEQKVAEYLKAREIAQTRPDLAPYIKLGGIGVNEFSVTKPRWRGSDALLNEANQLIYGQSGGPGKYSQTYKTEEVPSTPIGPTNEPNMSMVPPPTPGVTRVNPSASAGGPIGPSSNRLAGAGIKPPQQQAPPSPKPGWKYVRNPENNAWIPVRDTGGK